MTLTSHVFNFGKPLQDSDTEEDGTKVVKHYDYISYESWAKVKLSTNISFFNTTLDNKNKDNELVKQDL